MFMYFGFVLSEWEEFEDLKATLISAGRFQADRAIQRALYQYSADMVSISFLRWHSRRLTNPVASAQRPVMNVAGFREAPQSAIQVQSGYRSRDTSCFFTMSDHSQATAQTRVQIPPRTPDSITYGTNLYSLFSEMLGNRGFRECVVEIHIRGGQSSSEPFRPQPGKFPELSRGQGHLSAALPRLEALLEEE